MRHGALALGLLLTLVAGAALAQAGPVPPERFPKPDRPVAEIISPIWATEKERDAVDEVGQVARVLGITPGMAVADLGAGSGYYTTRLARIVGAGGRIYGEDVIPSYLDGLRERIARERLDNVTVVRGEPHDPALPPGSIDVAILIHMYHEIAQPFGFLHNLAAALRPGAKVGIVDLDGATETHGTPPKLLRCEVEAVGYRQIGFQRLKGGVGYLATFAPPDEGKLTPPGDIAACPSRGRP